MYLYVPSLENVSLTTSLFEKRAPLFQKAVPPSYVADKFTGVPRGCGGPLGSGVGKKNLGSTSRFPSCLGMNPSPMSCGTLNAMLWGSPLVLVKTRVSPALMVTLDGKNASMLVPAVLSSFATATFRDTGVDAAGAGAGG